MLLRIWAIAVKEFIQLIRFPMVLLGFTVAPVVELVLFASAIHTTVQGIPMVVADQSNSAASRAYLRAFTSSGDFDVVAAVLDQSMVNRSIDRGQAKIGLVIPSDFADELLRGDARALILVDGSDPFVSQAAYANASLISQQYAVSLIGGIPDPVRFHLQVLYNPALNDLWSIVPAFGAFLLYGIALKLTAFAIVRERENGTIEALLVTPIRPVELMLGKMAPNLAVAIVNMVLVFTFGIAIYGVPFRGSILLFSLLAGIFAIGSLGLGLAISSFSQTQVQANQLASLLNIAVLFLSGFLFPIDALPPILHALGDALPMTFFLPITRDVISKGAGVGDVWPAALSLLALTVAILTASVLLYRRVLD
jgi:ABC-2 type transport system permease protein